MNGWELHATPHRHYKLRGSWNVGKVRIAGVTSVLDGGQDNLTRWAASTMLAAAEDTATRWFGCGPAIANSLLSFGELTALSGMTPDAVRDYKAQLGTDAHSYLASWLVPSSPIANELPLPYGLAAGIEEFVVLHGPQPLKDEHGWRIERAVGHEKLAYAGTYDGQVRMWGAQGRRRAVHRIDLKTSNTVQPKHFAQLAAYEHAARACGEQRSTYLSIVHVGPCGTVRVHTIRAAGEDYTRALGMFKAALTIHRSTPKLAKLLKEA